MTDYTTLDPFNANAYTERILAQGTGDFAKMFKEKQNEILIQVAQAEPTSGTVLAAGVQRWNDNGSADILVATKVVHESGPTASRRSKAEIAGSQRLSRKDSSGRSAS